MQRDNRGFSLVEVMITVMIFAILVAGAVSSTNLVYSGNAKQAANDFCSLLTKCRVNTLNGADSPYIELYKDTSGSYIAKVYEKVPDASASDGYTYEVNLERELTNVSVTYTVKNGADINLATDALQLTFDRETGAFSLVDYDGDGYGNGALTEGECTYISFTSRNSTYRVQLNWQTGYSEVVR
ncbi:MAG: prepilin-type N-terminal cleavage/methylation domain-containing protein [Lachnospiraceae bacterium]